MAKAVLQIAYPDGQVWNYKTYKKDWTPTYECVEYDDYYEIANWAYYLCIDKQTLKITSNSKDVNQFLPSKATAMWVVDNRI
jgi:hypothetical protein